MTLNDYLHLSCAVGDLDEIKDLINRGADASSGNNYAIQSAAENGQIEVIRFLSTLPGVDPSALNNYAIKIAYRNDHLEVVNFLSTLPGVSLEDEESETIKPIEQNNGCSHVNTYNNIISATMKFKVCKDCGADLGDI